MSMSRRNLSRVAATTVGSALIFTLAACGTGAGDSSGAYQPSGTVYMTIPFPAGGGSDLFARTFMSFVEDEYDVTGTAENQDGGQGAPAHVFVSREIGNPNYLMPDDGSTVSLPLVSDVPYGIDDFTPLFRVAVDPLAIVVSSDSPYKSLEDLIDDTGAKIGIGGISAPDAAIPPLLEEKAGADFDVVTLDGGSEVVRGLLGGDIDAGTSNPSEIKGTVDSGDLRVLAMFTKERVPGWPDTPTATEQGVDIVWGQPRSMFAADDLSDDEVKFWVDAGKAWMKTDSFKQWQTKSGSLADFMSGDDLLSYFDEYGKTFEESAQ